MRTLKQNGKPWDFRQRSDRHEALQLIEDLDPEWVLGAPPCTAFSIWNYGLNYKKMDAETVRTKLAEGRMHLKFCCRMYRRQIKRGKIFLHEHPATAMSWSEECIGNLCKDPTTFLVKANQCAYGLTTLSEADRSILVPALKPTKFLTNSEIMSNQLKLRCTKDHDHQPLTGGRCKDAAMYPIPLVKAILRGIALQSKEGALR